VQAVDAATDMAGAANAGLREVHSIEVVMVSAQPKPDFDG